MNIRCQVSGLPKPDVMWTRNGQPLIPGTDIAIHENFTLTVRRTNTADSGKYICTARNRAGKDSVSSIVNVVGESLHTANEILSI